MNRLPSLNGIISILIRLLFKKYLQINISNLEFYRGLSINYGNKCILVQAGLAI